MQVDMRDRNALISDAAHNEPPLVVIGGGIYGAAIAWQAATRGVSVMLFERADFGGQTSANSLKIIHGGLRYLQSLDIPRVLESAREQKLLCEMAGHLARPLECLMPTYRDPARGRLAMGAGLLIYEFLKRVTATGMPAGPRGTNGTFGLGELGRRLPGLRDPRVTGGACWRDAQAINTERLVMAFVKSAASHGARVFNYAEVVAIDARGGRVSGIAVEDRLSGQRIEVPAAAVVDCTGPGQAETAWFAAAGGRMAPPCFLRAVNFMVRRPLAPVAVGFRSSAKSSNDDGARLLFATPWEGSGIIGTWYDDAGAAISADEVRAALSQVNEIFPQADLDLHDVTLIHEGYLPAARHGASLRLVKRPMIRHAGSSGGAHGLYFVQGVKFTTARAVAELVVEKVSRELGIAIMPRNRNGARLYGAPSMDVMAYESECLARLADRVDTDTIHRLVANYGVNIESILALAGQDPALGEPIPGAAATLRAEIAHVIDHEMVFTLSDLMLRRTDLGSHGVPHVDTIQYCADQLGARMAWDGLARKRNIDGLLSRYPSWSLEG